MGIDTDNKNKSLERIGFLVNAVGRQISIYSDFYLNTCISKPYMVLIEPTLRCPMQCKFCDLSFDETYPLAKEMDIDSWKRVLKELREFSPLISEIFISGGEPFLRPDMCDILEYAHSIGFGTRMVTIGALCSTRVCDRLINSPLQWLKFSIHSADEHIHNEIVGRPVYQKAIDAISYIRDHKYKGKIGILTTIVRDNVETLGEILKLAQKLEIDSVLFRPLFGNTTARRKFEDVVFKNESCVITSETSIRKAVDELKRLKNAGFPVANTDQQLDLLYRQTLNINKGVPGCHMMYESIYIRPNGDIEICGHMTLGTMGNVQSQTLASILNSKESYKARHSISRQCRCEGNAFVRKNFTEKITLVRDLLLDK